MKRDFEEYFPLPWNIETDEDESFWMITPARGGSFLDFGTIKVPKYADVRDVMNYIILCANLMPEAVELLGKCAREIQNRCDFCAGSYGRACIGCSNLETRAEIHALLAKLEGGMGE